MKWILYNSLDEFSPHHLYGILKLRQDIFIIEQNCIYNDIDGLDEKSSHILLQDDANIIAGYLRIVPPNIKFEEYSLGRIAVKRSYRGQGFGKEIVKKGIDTVWSEGARSIRIEAQAHLEDFYKETGFLTVSEVYDVDDIPHLQMILTT